MNRDALSAPVFESKRDAWIVILIWSGILVCGIGGIAQLWSSASIGIRTLIAIASLGGAAFMIWVLYSTRYIFESRVLLIRCGPFSFRVPFNEIGSVRPSRNPLSSPACSLDRLLISWRNNSRKILISPEGQAEFLHRLAQRCPQLRLQGDRLVIAAQN